MKFNEVFSEYTEVVFTYNLNQLGLSFQETFLFSWNNIWSCSFIFIDIIAPQKIILVGELQTFKISALLNT
jgi:hypothetical protein